MELVSARCCIDLGGGARACMLGCSAVPCVCPDGMICGQCAQMGCTVGNDATCTSGGDGHCANLAAGPGCLDLCDVDSDCREAEGYVCFQGAASKFCRHPQTGDACTTDADCGDEAARPGSRANSPRRSSATSATRCSIKIVPHVVPPRADERFTTRPV